MLGRLIILLTLHALLTRLFQSIQLILNNLCLFTCHYCYNIVTNVTIRTCHQVPASGSQQSVIMGRMRDMWGMSVGRGWYHHMQLVAPAPSLWRLSVHLSSAAPCDVWSVQQCSSPASDWSVFTLGSSDWPMPTPGVTHPCHAPRPVL